MSIKIISNNILEDGAVTVTGTPDTGYPEARLWDRSINLYWKDTATGAYEFEVDQGASNIVNVDTLFISGHNFDGEDMQWQYSDNGVDWSDAVTDWTQSGNGDISKTLTSANHRYWKVTVTSLTNPICTEIFMGLAHEFNVQARPDPTHVDVENVSWNRSIGGQERGIQLGAKRRRRTYTTHASSAELTNFHTIVSDLDDYSKPFLFKDKDDTYFMARFESPPQEDYFNQNETRLTFRIIEEL